MKVYILKDTTISLDTTNHGAAGTYTYKVPAGPYTVQEYGTTGAVAGKVTLFMDKVGADETTNVDFADCYESLAAAQNKAKTLNAATVAKVKAVMNALSVIK